MEYIMSEQSLSIESVTIIFYDVLNRSLNSLWFCLPPQMDSLQEQDCDYVHSPASLLHLQAL